jgi:SAM-dependent methyltransferase
MEKTEVMYEKFLDEYVSEDAVRKYTTLTAGHGITHLLRHEYARIYLNALDKYLLPGTSRPLRLLEFGCGGGMNITRLLSLLVEKKIPIDQAYGTDFSPRLVEAAGQEAKAYLPASLAKKVQFYVARNERLQEDLVEALGNGKEIAGSFDLIIGVNTFRYCHRIGKELDCAQNILRLLRPGGICINIDMNAGFPAFRSRLRRNDLDNPECYLPTLEEYSAPFKASGFEVLQQKNFCWIPHSAGVLMTRACQLASPFLNMVARKRAMRSLVIARRAA